MPDLQVTHVPKSYRDMLVGLVQAAADDQPLEALTLAIYILADITVHTAKREFFEHAVAQIHENLDLAIVNCCEEYPK